MMPSQTSVPLGKAVSRAKRRRPRDRRWWALIPLLAALVTLAAVLFREFRPMAGPVEKNSSPSNITGIQSNGDNASIAVETLNVGSDQAALAQIQKDLEKRQAQAEQERKDRNLEENRKKDEERQRQHRTNVARKFLEQAGQIWAKSIEPFQPRNIVVHLVEASFDSETKEMRVRGTVFWHGGLPNGKESVEKMWPFAVSVYLNGGYPRGPREGQLELVLQEGVPGEFTPKQAISFGENDAVMALTELQKTIKIGEVFLQSRSQPRR